MLCIPAEFEIDNESIILQMKRVREASWKLEEEMTKLRHLIDGTKVKEKGNPAEFDREKEFAEKWLDAYREQLEKQKGGENNKEDKEEKNEDEGFQS